MRLLLIEDDSEVASYLVKGLQESGYTIDHCINGKEGLVLATSEEYDTIILDRMLPGIDGMAILKSVRAAGIKTPILVLSTLGEVDDRVEGLQAGADDYLTKPFAFSELHARLAALQRRSGRNLDMETVLHVGDLDLDLLSRTAIRANRTIELQPREFRLLEYLMRHAGQVVTRTMLLEHVWDYHFDPQTNVIDVHISRLRSKIDKEQSSSLLHTIRGAGYMINESC